MTAERVAEDFGGDVTYADSTINNIGGHALHVVGGADLMWRQVGHLTQAFREVSDLVDFLRAYTCPGCGEPAAPHMNHDVPSPFLKFVLANEENHE